ncbi:hypothetical protein CRG98_015774 [Punica granatum]|uniref:Uncharacterized protein n=1 Tax=Punica granatum TaxID=22663 RepID=A0A2I0K6L1_PUNGR|nr:hypothetical protein CRG98_015774 [Punica granatum]
MVAGAPNVLIDDEKMPVQGMAVAWVKGHISMANHFGSSTSRNALPISSIVVYLCVFEMDCDYAQSSVKVFRSEDHGTANVTLRIGRVESPSGVSLTG